MYLKKSLQLLLLFFIVSIPTLVKSQPYLPSGFIDTVVSANWNFAVGIQFDKNGQMYVWEKGGRVWVVDTNGVKHNTPLINISEEVGNFGDNGFNGFCLDPDFLNNGFMYLYYTVDRHYLINFGTPLYSSTTNEFNAATICRVTRYKADSATNFNTIVPGSRFILIGEDKKQGIPVLYSSHTGGSLLFGADSSLIISAGDGASYSELDTGSVLSSYWMQALADTIIDSAQNVGAFRAQMLNSLNGKILRIDRFTGNGLNSNPYFDSTDVRSAKSRIYAIGFRNPFRMALLPNTGSTDITAGNPGVIIVGDVGWKTNEELDIIKKPNENFGWPIYEGLSAQPGFLATAIENKEAPNALYNIGSCSQPYYYFTQLIKDPLLSGTPFFANPCDTFQKIPDNLVWIHKRPDMDWRHNFNITRVPGFSGGNAVPISITDPNSSVTGNPFAGNASVGGIYYTGTSFPSEYNNTYFHCDYGQGWINNFKLDSANNITSVSAFDTLIGLGKIVSIAENPRNGCLVYIYYEDSIRQICYTGQVNYPPHAIATADTIYGQTPLTVQFNGSNSTDPENHPLNYFWSFGDATTSTLANPQHIFSAPSGIPTTFNVSLVVTDDSNYTSVAALKIFINNTPPSVSISSIPQGTLYSITAQTNLPLEAIVSDNESANNLLHYEWETILYHNQHTHPGLIDTDSVTNTVLTPIGCDGETYLYKIVLNVFDPQGMVGHDFVDVFPDCNAAINNLQQIANGYTIKVFPNPTNSNQTVVNISNLKSFKCNTARLKVLSVDGRLLFENKIDLEPSATEINIPIQFSSLLKAGFYFINVSLSDQQLFTKIIIQ